MARMVSGKALVKVKNEVKLENTLPARVDISTMRRLPWVDFDTILDNTESAQREQVILDILQNNMPSSGDDMYYIYNKQTNTFSIEVDENSDELQDFVEGILTIDARLRVQDLPSDKRKNLIRKRQMKLKELIAHYRANALADVLSKRLSEVERPELEEKIIEIQNRLNKDNDDYYYVFNEDTQEFELRLEQDLQLIHDIVAAILKLSDKTENTNTPAVDRRGMSSLRQKFLRHL